MPVSTQSGVSTNTGATVAYTAAITILLAVLYAAQSIAVTNSKTNGIYNYDPNSAVMATGATPVVRARAEHDGWWLIPTRRRVHEADLGDVAAGACDPAC